MTDNDLIRRGDALYAIAGWEIPSTAIAALPAVTVGVRPLVEAVEALNAACDAMWNDHERLERNPDRWGQKMRIKERHLKAITEAQQRLPAILAALDLTPAPDAAGRAAALREAADAVEDYCADMPDLAGHGHSVGLRDTILALLPKGGDGRRVYMGQIMAECDCPREAECQAAGRCIAEGRK